LVGELTRLRGRAAATVESNIHIDDYLGETRIGRTADGFLRVDRNRDARIGVGKGTQPGVVDDLVSEQNVRSEAGGRESERLARGCTCQALMPGGTLLRCEGGALVCLDVGTTSRAGQGARHRFQVMEQRSLIYQQAWGLEFAESARC
jgi:hypothetical protein